MRSRYLIVTKESNVKDVATLCHHPNVRKFWRLPRAYVLFEFYHPVFERVYDDDPVVSNTARAEESVQQQIAAAMAEEHAILEPLYKETKRESFLVPGRTAFTIFWSRHVIAWPKIKLYPGWETAKEVVFNFRLMIVSGDTMRELRELIREWASSGIAQNEITSVSSVEFGGNEAHVKCSFAGETCTDAIMALFMLIAETRALTSIESFERLVTAGTSGLGGEILA